MPLFIFILIIFNSVIKNYGIKSLYVYIIVMGIVLLLLDYSIKFKKKKLYIPYFYLLVLTIVFIIQIFYYNTYITVMIKGYVIYTLIPFYWIIFFHKYNMVDFRNLLISTIPIVYIIALLGIIQFFISPNLFGLLNNHDSLSIAWAAHTKFSKYILFFRSSSVLGSPQVFGLFLAFYFIIVMNLSYFKNNILNQIGLVLLIFGGILSGDKSFALILILYILYRLFKIIKTKKFFYLISIGLIFLFFNYNWLLKTRQVGRIININQIIKQEKNDSRINRYRKIILNSNIIIGDGIGVRIFQKDIRLKATESYFIQILSETGIITLFIFLNLLYLSYLLSSKCLFNNVKFLIIAIGISMIFVHAFISPVFFIFWGIILVAFTNSINNVKRRKYIENIN
jgi:hypothetical protein